MKPAPASSPGRKLAHNALLMLGQHAFVTIAGIVVSAFIAQRLGPDDYGIFEYTFAFVAGFSLLAGFGLRAVTVRSVAQKSDEVAQYLGLTIALRLALAAVAALVLLSTSQVLHDEPLLLWAVALAALTLPMDALSTAIRDVFQGLERFDVEATTAVIVRAATVVGAVVALHCGGGVLTVVGVYTGGGLLKAAIPILAARRAGLVLRLRWSRPAVKRELGLALPFAGSALVSLLMWDINPILLGELSSMSMVGIFAAGSKLFGPLEMIPAALAAALAPAVAKAWVTGEERIHALLERSFFLLATLGLPLGVGGFLCADLIVALLYGDGYAEATPVMRILIAALPFEFLSVPAFYVLGAIHQQRVAFFISCGGAAINLGLALWLIPKMGALGCAWSTAGSIVFCFLAAHLALARHYRVWRGWMDYLKLFFASAIMAAIVQLTRPWGAVAAVTAGASSYGAVVFFTGLVKLDEARALFRGRFGGDRSEEGVR